MERRHQGAFRDLLNLKKRSDFESRVYYFKSFEKLFKKVACVLIGC